MLIAAPLTLFNLVREIVYLAPTSRYWIEVSAKGYEFSSPLGQRLYRWQEIAPFVVSTLPMRGWRIVRIVAHVASWRWICIRSDDFATGLSASRREAAAILAGILNDFTRQVDAERSATVRVPAGLKIGLAAAPSERSPAKVAIVVRER